MRYLDVQKAMHSFPVFSVNDLRRYFGKIDSRRLTEWQEKGYLTKIRQGYYKFSNRIIDDFFLMHTANKIYSPSYISLETALSYHGLIPEGVFATTSVTTKNTSTFTTPFGEFTYRNIKPEVFFGYSIIRQNNVPAAIAEPEKALLDFIWFKKPDNDEDFEALRLNQRMLKETINWQKMINYAELYRSPALAKRVKKLKHFAYAES